MLVLPGEQVPISSPATRAGISEDNIPSKPVGLGGTKVIQPDCDRMIRWNAGVSLQALQAWCSRGEPARDVSVYRLAN